MSQFDRWNSCDGYWHFPELDHIQKHTYNCKFCLDRNQQNKSYDRYWNSKQWMFTKRSEKSVYCLSLIIEMAFFSKSHSEAHLLLQIPFGQKLSKPKSMIGIDVLSK